MAISPAQGRLRLLTPLSFLANLGAGGGQLLEQGPLKRELGPASDSERWKISSGQRCCGLVCLHVSMYVYMWLGNG